MIRNEAFWEGELEPGPLLWVTAPLPNPAAPPSEPELEEELWTDAEYVLAAAEDRLSRTVYLGDALPVYTPWLGPDQFAAWLGAELILRPRTHNTSWVVPFLEDWESVEGFEISPDNRWWRLYLELMQLSVEKGRDKWVTGYPDLHTGIDALSAIRGPELLGIDLVEQPERVQWAMGEMTRLWKEVVDKVASVIAPGGQGASNWTMGWSRRRFLCVGQNDFTCMISPEMYQRFCAEDVHECVAHVDCSIYHLDGPGAIRHLPMVLAEPRLNCIQWIPGAAAPPPSQWLDLLRQVQAAGKTVQVWPLLNRSEGELLEEIELLCGSLDPRSLFIVAEVSSAELGRAVLRKAEETCGSR